VSGIAAAGQRVAVVRIDHDVGFDRRLGQFLDEQRHAVGFGDDLIPERIGQRLVAVAPFRNSLSIDFVRLAGKLPPSPRVRS